MIFEKDVCITLRDSTKIYVDIFRPTTSSPTKRCPVIAAIGPYGKHQNNNGMLAEYPHRVGVPLSTFSGYENFEGPDPAYWVEKGYAVVNVDIRGSWHSEGDLYFWGKQAALDGYDTVGYLGTLPWSNGKVGLAGNSWLAINQWFVAAESPPHLAAIAPWEALSDVYRDQHRRGGIPSAVMPSALGLLAAGLNKLEDAGGMASRNSLWNEYWEDKCPELHKITVPAYVLASYSSKIHSAGSFRGFRDISSKEKWLRVHPTQEWHDWPHWQDDLVRFFDCYLKGIENDWKHTPTVRCSILRFNGESIINLPFSSYPPPTSNHQTFYLDASKSAASQTSPDDRAEASYKADSYDDNDSIHFDIVFDTHTKVIGYPNLTLTMSCAEADDMDVFVILRKLDSSGKPLIHKNYPCATPVEDLPRLNPVLYQGPTGQLRLSHRATASSSPTSPGEIFHSHLKEEKIKKGEKVTFQMSTWPIGMVFEKGESLRVVISGHEMCFPETNRLSKDKNWNTGSHVLYTGKEYKSSIALPVVKE
jgi:uncharacterized protein